LSEGTRGRPRIGTSSFSSKDWVGPFYAPGTSPGDFLRHYAAAFDTVEVDSTYYAIPSESMVDGWVDKTPDHFLLCAKFPRAIVHGGDGPAPDGAKLLDPDHTYGSRDKFLAVMSRLGTRLGPLVLQFPYFSRKVFVSRDAFVERLNRFLGDLPKDFSYAVEIRNKAWLTKDFADVCRSHKVTMVLVDQAWMPMPDELDFDPVTTEQAYVRLLGDRKEIEAITKSWGAEVIDREEKLGRWASILADMVHRNVSTLVYVNNHYAGHAPTTVRRLKKLFDDRMERR
jgi:uncharacterized protein YecE (DUF72 family)